MLGTGSYWLYDNPVKEEQPHKKDTIVRRVGAPHPPEVPSTQVEFLKPDPFGEEQTAVYWPDEVRGPWRVVVHWAKVEGRVLPIGITVASFEDDGHQQSTRPGQPVEVTRDLFKRLPIAGLLERSRLQAQGWADLVNEPGSFWPTDYQDQSSKYARALASTTKLRAGRPRDHDPDFYAEVARLYLIALQGGGEPSRKPARYVHDALVSAGRLRAYTEAEEALQRAQRDQVRKYIQTARRDGLIPPAGRRQKEAKK